MKMRTLAAASVALGLVGAASSANALTITTLQNNDLYGTSLLLGQSILYDFDGYSAANVAWSGTTAGPFETGDPITNSSPPPYAGGIPPVTIDGIERDPTVYGSVQDEGLATFSTTNGYYLSSFSFYMGSPDEYNKVTLTYRDGSKQVLQGNAIWGGNPQGDGNRANGYRVYYDFGSYNVSSLTFESGDDAFEFDGLAGTLGVPEPSTWALMIMGFGGAGAMIRRRKAALA